MRVLVTNSALALRGGTEAYVQDLVAALLRAGHDVCVYSNVLGETAADLRTAGATVIADLTAAPWTPDVLHCHHNIEAVTALLHFTAAPAIFVAHGWVGWLDAPVRHPRILRYVAIHGPAREAMIGRYGIPDDSIRLIPNFMDLSRFAERGPLPAVPRKALILSHYARWDTHVPVVQEACRRCNLALDVVGYGVGRPVQHPEDLLPEYDIVFAKGRAALEAIVVGNAVVVCDSFGMGPMVSTTNIEVLRTLEGDYLRWYSPLGVDALVREIRKYDPADARDVSRRIRSLDGADAVVPELVDLYEQARSELARSSIDPAADSRAAAAYLAWTSKYIKERLVERDPLAGLAIRWRNRLARVPFLAPLLLRVSARIQRRWPATRSPGDVESIDRAKAGRLPPDRPSSQP